MIGITYPNSAYRRIHANAKIASTGIVIVVILSFLCLSFHFVAHPTPSEYTTISEASIYIGDYVLNDTSWDATDLQSPHRKLLPREDDLPTSESLVQAETLSVDGKAK